MDRSDIATCGAGRKASILLSILVVLLSVCFTGCDTVQSADSSPKYISSTKSPSAYHQIAATAPPKAAPQSAPQTSPAPVPPAEKPVIPKTPEPVQSPAVPVRPVVETKPAPTPAPAVAPAPAPAKGAETLVALSTGSAPRTSDPAGASQKAPRTSAQKTENTASTSEPQGLFFKGPERPAPAPSHKFVWLALGLGICAATGGGLTWLRLNRTRQMPMAFPVKKQSDDDVELPREFKVKERRIYVEEEPVTTDKS